MEVGAGGLRKRYDLIIVGTGPAGLTLARKYEERTGNEVLVVESGPRSVTGENPAQRLASTQATGDLESTHYTAHSPAQLWWHLYGLGRILRRTGDTVILEQ